MHRRTRADFTIMPIAILGSALLLAPPAALAQTPAPAANAPAVTVHPQPEAGSPQGQQAHPTQVKPMDPDSRIEADRAAFFSARLAALHAGLSLTPDQDALWPPVEAALRDLAKTGHHAWRRQADQAGDTGPIARLKRQGDRLVARGDAIRKLADATGPLLGALSEEQRARLPMLLRGVRAKSIVARAFELRRDDMDLYGQGPDDRGMGGDDMGRGGPRYGMRDGPRFDRQGPEAGPGGYGPGGDRQGMDEGGEPPIAHHRHHRHMRDDDGGFEDIAFRT